ncbi:MAG: efflux RND transporter permease subunit [Psychroflexus sp.]|nr:efflux RND transporter permease subunit [Psychroflexus sp.]MDR9448874.1 efflux RND transporter permease subunit [Psychroflexus sp.]
MSKKNTYREFFLSSWAIDNKLTVSVIIAIILVLGSMAYYSMPRESFPEIVEKKIYISSVNPGSSVKEIEKFITEPLEEEFKNVKSVNEISSTSLQDYSMVVVEFEESINVEFAKQLIKDKVDQVKAETTWPTLDNGAKVEPNVFDLNISEEMPILNINFKGNYTSQKLKDYAEHLQDKIELLPQIKEATIRGVDEKEVEVAVDVFKMTATQVSFQDIISAINSENTTISGGELIRNGVEKNIRIKGEIEKPEELLDIVVKDEGDKSVYLADVAEVNFHEKDPTTFAREFGKPAVTINVKKRSGKNMVQAVNEIRKITDKELADYYPADLDISLTNDQSIRTVNQVNDLVNNIIFGVLLVVTVLMFFLGFRNALFVGVAIPLSMLLSLAILNGLGYTLNTMILFGLVMGLGMLVDNGIVVVENVYRLMAEGVPRIKAAKQGIGEIALPIIASTATTLAAFFPLGLWPGTIGKFMIYFPITLSVVLGSSLLVALLINSMLTSQLMKVKEKPLNKQVMIRWSLILVSVGVVLLVSGYTIDSSGLRGFGNLSILAALLLWFYKYVLTKGINYFQYTLLPKLERIYESNLRFALAGKRAYFAFFGTILILISSFVLVGVVKPDVLFFPENEPNQIITYIEYPEGTSIYKTNELTKKVEKRIFEVAEKYNDDGYNFMVESAVSQVGKGSGNPQKNQGVTNEMPHRGKITLLMREFKLRRNVKSSKVLKEVRQAVQGFAGASITVEKDQAGPPQGYEINIEISGEDYDLMLAETERMRRFINNSGISGIEELKIDVNKQKPELALTVDREKAGELGVSTGFIAQTIRRSIFGEEASTFKDGDEDYEINVRFNEENRYDESAIMNQPVTFRNNKGQMVQVPISTLVNKKNSATFSSIKREDLKRVITLYSNVLQGYNPTATVGKIKSELKSGFDLDNSLNYQFTGQQEEQQKNQSFLLKALFFALGGILLILVAQFNSLSKPLIIISSVVLSLAGVFYGLTVFQMDFIIIMTMMGIISLAGIVVNNAIVLVDYTQILIDRKKEELDKEFDDVLSKKQYYEAIVQGGKARLRPVLLTAITTILGLIPLAIGLNIDFFGLFTDYAPDIWVGGDNVIFWGPLAWTVIFGLIFATFLTLVVVPVMLYLNIRAKLKFRKS